MVASRRGLPPAGDEFGALRLPKLDSLYGDQQRAAEAILGEVHRIAAANFRKRPSSNNGQGRNLALDAPVGSDPSDFHRPHHAYVIDGKRGSGKTSVLLTLHPYLSGMRLGARPGGSRPSDDEVQKDLQALDLEPIQEANGERVALVLPIVFTEDMELHETTMEAVLALMEHEIEDALRQSRDDHERRNQLKELQHELRLKVGLAWTYSRKIGAEALPNDALDYQDFVMKRADLSRAAYTKIMTWRRYLNRYLDMLGYQVLVLLFDDSDLNPAIAEDMIRTVRMYLSHPRVVSIVAVDLETLRTTLTSRNIVQHQSVHLPSPSIEDSLLYQIKEEAVLMEHINVGHLLDKVLPRPNRHRLKMSNLSHIDYFFKDKAELESADDLSIFCRNRFESTEDEERKLTWWFLCGPYRRMIAGDLRAVISFRRQVQEGNVHPLEALLNRAALSSLLERVDGSLELLVEFVEGGEYDDKLPSDSLLEEEIRYIDLVLDVSMAKSGLDQGLSGALATWLPTSALAGERRELNDGGRIFGVSSLIRNDLAPRNCLYLHHFRHIQKPLEDLLPDASQFADWLEGSDRWPVEGSPVLTAASNLLAALTGEHDERISLTRLTFPVRDILRGVRLTGTSASDAEGQFEDQASTATVALAIAAAVQVPRPRARKGSKQPIVAALENLVATLGEAPGETPDNFPSRLSVNVTKYERLRQEALFTWACANELAALGDDATALNVRHAPRMLAQLMAGPSSTGNVSRFAALSRTTVDRVKGKGVRHRLLHAWSLLPLLDVIYDYGADYLRGQEPTSAAWENVAGLLEAAADPFGTVPGEMAELRWAFPDLSPDNVTAIVNEVRFGAAKLRTDLRNEAPAGSIQVDLASDAFWEAPPARRLAGLLGTSERWVRKNLGV